MFTWTPGGAESAKTTQSEICSLFINGNWSKNSSPKPAWWAISVFTKPGWILYWNKYILQ